MSGKPKVYQGVRVKITVKELLQQRRAKQAAVEEAVSGEGCSGTPLAGSFSPPCPAPFADGSLESPPSAGCLQPWPFQSCLSCEEMPSYLEQLVDSCLQTEPPLDVSLGLLSSNLPCSTDESFQPGSFCITQNLGPGSPGSSDPSSSFDYTYSPLQPPPFAPIGYSTPSPPETKSCMYPSSEEIPFQQHDTQFHPAASPCCCTSCGSQHLDSLKVPEYFPYVNTDCREFAPSVSVGDDFFGRDRSWDACYS